MSLGFVGDIHGSIGILKDVVKEAAEYPHIKAVIQVGDFGVRFSKGEKKRWKHKKWKFDTPTYFIDGNHEYFEYLPDTDEPTELLPNLFYVPRGTVLELDGKNVAFMGGGASIDYKFRLQNGYHWDTRENITPEQVERLKKNIEGKKIDIFVTHVPPLGIEKTHFNPMKKLSFGVSLEWEDPNMFIVERLWHDMGRPRMVCGHMHEYVRFGEEGNSLILSEFQFVTI